MRVLIAHGEYRTHGGEERHVGLLEEGLRSAGVDVAVHRRGPATESLTAKLRLGAGLAYRPSAGRELAAQLERHPADVVHFHNLMPLFTPAALRSAKRSGAAVVWTIHNYRFACPAGTLLRNGRPHDDCIEGSSLACGLRGGRDSVIESTAYGVALELQRRLGLLERWVDAYVAPSAYVARLLVRAGYAASRIRIVRNAVPIGPPANGAPTHALFAGRLAPEKGIGTLLDAARRLPGLPLLFAGDGPLTPTVRAAENRRIRYAGNVAPERVSTLLGRAAFAVVPSECPENQPFAAIEALAAGVPVIATRIGGLPEIVEDGVNGLLVPPGDAPALASAMRTLWDDVDLRVRLGQAARRTAAERFSIAGQTQQLLDLYARVRSTP